jgi:tRNA(fMet)-specific endonuclease VapC
VKYLLDTDHISFLQRRSAPEHAILLARMSERPLADFAFSVVSFHEQALGAHTYVGRARTTADLIRGYTLLSDILQAFLNAPVLPFDAAAGAALDGLRVRHVRIAAMDLRIAAIALSRKLVLLTRNERDFSRVPGLRTEDWTT